MRWTRRPAAALLGILGWVAAAGAVAAQEAPVHEYIGVAACGKCHKTEKNGNQLAIWEQTQHAKAYETLTTPRADSIALAAGLTTKAAESETCLGCHTAGGASAVEFRKEGVGCEACHNAGSGYKPLSVMKNKAKSIALGLREFADSTAREALCLTCHNDKSPTAKPFDFAERWDKMKHLVPVDPP